MNRRDALDRAPRLSRVDLDESTPGGTSDRRSYVSGDEISSRHPASEATRVARLSRPSYVEQAEIVAPYVGDAFDNQPTRSARESYVALEELAPAKPAPAVSSFSTNSDSVTAFHAPRASVQSIHDADSVTTYAARPSVVAAEEQAASASFGDMAAPYEIASRDVGVAESDVVSQGGADDNGEPLDYEALERYLFDEAPPPAIDEPVTSIYAVGMDSADAGEAPAFPEPRAAMAYDATVRATDSGGTPINSLLPRLAQIQQVMAQRQRASMLPAHESSPQRTPVQGWAPTARSPMTSMPPRAPMASMPRGAMGSIPFMGDGHQVDGAMPDSGFNAWALPASASRPMGRDDRARAPESFKLTLTALLVGMTGMITLAVIVLAIVFVGSEAPPAQRAAASARAEGRTPSASLALQAPISATTVAAAPPAASQIVISSDDIPMAASPPGADATAATKTTAATVEKTDAPMPRAETKAEGPKKVEKTEKAEKAEKAERSPSDAPAPLKRAPAKTQNGAKSVEQMLEELGEEQLRR